MVSDRNGSKKEDENYKFNGFLKRHADEGRLDKQFLRLHKDCLLIMIT